jgi:ubiquinone/menaquinone biosynthesis C-methylase UbiE
MAETEKSIVWADGDAYEKFMGQWSRLSGVEFVKWIAPDRGLTWLDVGCGTGAFTSVILECCSPAGIVGIDPAEAHLADAKVRVANEMVEFRVADALALPFGEDEFDIAASAYVLNFVPDQEKMVAEMTRVVRPSGIVAACVWDFAGGKPIAQHMGAAIAARNPQAAKQASTLQNAESTRPEALSNLFAAAGLKAVDTRPIEITVRFESFDDYWSSNTGFASPVARFVKSLSSEDRDQFMSEVKERLRFGDDGSIQYMARASAVRGIVP